MKKFNIHFFILFFIAIMVSVSDTIIYILNTSFIPTNIIVGIVLFALTMFLKKKEKIAFETNYSKIDVIFIAFLCFFVIFSIVFPDLSWDTRSYHVYTRKHIY